RPPPEQEAAHLVAQGLRRQDINPEDVEPADHQALLDAVRVRSINPSVIGALQPPVAAGEKLDLAEWRHVATQGRDHYVRIVYEGILFPFGHKASLVKITERKFHSSPSGSAAGSPVAYLFQRMYIV